MLCLKKLMVPLDIVVVPREADPGGDDRADLPLGPVETIQTDQLVLKVKLVNSEFLFS